MGCCAGEQDYKKEAQIGNNPDSLTSDQLKQALLFLENSICKIKPEKGPTGTGFLCKIRFPDPLNLLPVLITCNHVINKNDLKKKYRFFNK